jgi:hypothetical protein
MGLEALRESDCLQSVGCYADNTDALMGFEQAAQAFASTA